MPEVTTLPVTVGQLFELAAAGHLNESTEMSAFTEPGTVPGGALRTVDGVSTSATDQQNRGEAHTQIEKAMLDQSRSFIDSPFRVFPFRD